MLKRKPSFFERLTGAIKIEDADDGFLDEEDDYRNEKPVQSSRKVLLKANKASETKIISTESFIGDHFPAQFFYHQKLTLN